MTGTVARLGTVGTRRRVAISQLPATHKRAVDSQGRPRAGMCLVIARCGARVINIVRHEDELSGGFDPEEFWQSGRVR